MKSALPSLVCHYYMLQMVSQYCFPFLWDESMWMGCGIRRSGNTALWRNLQPLFTRWLVWSITKYNFTRPVSEFAGPSWPLSGDWKWHRPVAAAVAPILAMMSIMFPQSKNGPFYSRNKSSNASWAGKERNYSQKICISFLQNCKKLYKIITLGTPHDRMQPSC